MPQQKTLADVKRSVSSTLLNQSGVSGVGLRGEGVVIYLESDDSATRQAAKRVVEKISPTTPVVFEVTGRIGKQ